MELFDEDIYYFQKQEAEMKNHKIFFTYILARCLNDLLPLGQEIFVASMKSCQFSRDYSEIISEP